MPPGMLNAMKTLIIAALLSLVTPARAQSPTEAAERALDDALMLAYARSPIWMEKYVEHPTMAGDLPDESPEAYAEHRREQAELLARVDGLAREGLDEDTLLAVDLVRYQLALDLESADLFREQMPVNSIGGPQYWLPQLGSFSRLLTERDHENYLSRMSQVPRVLEQSIEQMRAGIAAGRVAPRPAVEPAVSQARAQAVDSAERSPFFKPFLARPESDPQAQRARSIIRDQIAPAYAAFADFLEREYLPACRETVGISQSVDGVRAYELALREHTTLPLNADEVHRIGLREVARIRAEMHETIKRTDWYGASGSSIADDDERFRAFTEFLRTDPRFYFTTEDELLDAYRAAAKRIDPELVRLFGRLPRLPYGIRPIPPFAAKFSPTAYYYAGSIDEGRPGYFMANTSELNQRPAYDIIALTLHEAMPGHHLENALNDELESVHPVRRATGFTAFGEGWGLYSERLGLEMGDDPERGLYADPYDDFGRLNFEIWRAIRLVVDSGLHAKGWTRQRAIDYMRDNSGASERNIANEIDRYIGWPGQATAYKIGELKIRELRAMAEQELGDRFDVRAFHDHLLGAGSLPLPVLEERMRRWVDGNLAGDL